MTMYNEDDGLFSRTIHGAMRNLTYLCKLVRGKTGGKHDQKKVTVCRLHRQ